jgi:chromosome segregation ATPase
MRTIKVREEHIADMQARIAACIELQDTLRVLEGHLQKVHGSIRWLRQALDDMEWKITPSPEELQERLDLIAWKEREASSLDEQIRYKRQELEFLQEGMTFRMAHLYDLDPLKEQWHLDIRNKLLTCQSEA